jgi:glycerol-3-phosphate dehydrogenase
VADPFLAGLCKAWCVVSIPSAAGASRLSAISGEGFDVAIIGGGIIGCGIARDAALRGLRVALFERADFGSGTTAASTRIVHGGLRYLEMLDFRLVRLDLRERETLLRIAPHLVKPLEFLIPFMAGAPVSPFKLRLGLTLYDALSYDRSLPPHRVLGAAEARGLDRALLAAPIRGGAAYFDARVDLPERLALENALDAEANGAQVFNYAEVLSTTVKNGSAGGVRVRDLLSGSETDVEARLVVNATGAWWERVASAQTGRRHNRIRTTKGVHIVCPALTDRALVLFSDVDRRLMFAIPRAGLTWIGTTDTDYDGDPAEVRATRTDVDYLLRSVQTMFPSLTFVDVLHTTAGVRALVTHGGSASTVSRMHKVVSDEPMPGVISVLGGKITGYRAIAEDVTDAVCRRIGVTRRCATAESPLPGARRHSPAGSDGIPDFLRAMYGTRAGEVMIIARKAEHLTRPLSPRYPDVGAQVVFGVREEHCFRVSDFVRRRTLLGASADQGWDAAPGVATLMAAELGWSTGQTAAELEACRRDIERARAFKEDS